MRQYNPAATEQAIALYKQALAIDPSYAPAWDGLADGYYNLIDLGVVPPLGCSRWPTKRIAKALANDPHYAPAYARAAGSQGAIAGTWWQRLDTWSRGYRWIPPTST